MRMNRALLAAFLCSAVAPAGMCEPGGPVSPFNAGQWPTLSGSVSDLRRTEPAPTTTSLGAPPMPEPAVVLLNLPEGAAWSLVKTTVGENIGVLRPNWLPERFRTESVMIEYAYTSFPRYRVGYATNDGLILVAAGAVNSASPDQSMAIDIAGVTATYSVTSSWPERQVGWEQSGVFYSIQARGVTESELLQVARGLTDVTVIGTGSDPQPVIAPALPSTSTAPDPELQMRLLIACLGFALAVAGGVMLLLPRR
jgi:hypothetical protein